MKKARANAVSNKTVATAALRRKKQHEAELDRLSGTRMTLEAQVSAIESANINQETMAAMKKGADALKVIHAGLTIDKVDATMDSIREQMDLQTEISDAISNPLNVGAELDDEELKHELAELEQQELDDKLLGAENVPIHAPAGPSKVTAERERRPTVEEEDEEAQLKELQAALAM